MTSENSLFRTNVQPPLSDEGRAWAEKQWAKREERMTTMSRADYYSVLGDLYEQINPPLATALLKGVVDMHPTLLWLDRAIVVNMTLLKFPKLKEPGPSSP